MPRQPRRVIANTPHHLVLRGNNRRKIFSYEYDRARFLSLMREAPTSCQVHALCLMSNHVHIIASPSQPEDLGLFVKYFAQRYAQIRNQRLRSSGKLFEARYWSRPIESESYLAIATAYVDDNARTANLARTEDFAWSTLGLHTGAGNTHRSVERLWTPSGWYSSLGAHSEQRHAAYSDWLDRYRQHKDWAAATSGLPERLELAKTRRPNHSRVA